MKCYVSVQVTYLLDTGNYPCRTMYWHLHLLGKYDAGAHGESHDLLNSHHRANGKNVHILVDDISF